MQSLYSAASALKNQQTRLDVIAANIANSTTPGYKSSRVDFKDAMYELMLDPVGNSLQADLLRGSGMLISGTTEDFSNGTLQPTGNLLDLAVNGSGFFTVQDAQGNQYYTRNGSFTVSEENGENVLVTADGKYVLDDQGNKITLTGNLASVRISSAGRDQYRRRRNCNTGAAEFSKPGRPRGRGRQSLQSIRRIRRTHTSRYCQGDSGQFGRFKCESGGGNDADDPDAAGVFTGQQSAADSG